MGSSRRPPPTEAAALRAVEAAADRLLGRGDSRILVAASGGLDSSVLLDILARRAPAGRLHVAHVDHRLQPDSANWARRVEASARARGLDCTVWPLDGAPARGESLEAWAREARYAALRRIARGQGCTAIACAHHADDQIETLLLALDRGAGVRGLAAMREAHGAGIPVLRPLLSLRRAELAQYARARGIEFVEDPSNSDPARVRNAIRHRVLPAVDAVLPGFRAGAARAIAHLAEADELLGAIGRETLDAVAVGPAELDAGRLAALSGARQALALRSWFAAMGWPMPSSARLAEWRRLLACVGAAPVRVRWQGHWVCRYRERIWAEPVRAALDCAGVALDWRGESRVALQGFDATLHFEPGGVLDPARLRGRRLILRPGRGSERLRLRGDGPSRTLKNLWQEAGIPPWWRDGLPVIEVDGELLFAAAFGPASPSRDPGRGPVDSGSRGEGLRLRFAPTDAADPRQAFLGH